jgi:hypothetical protein
MREPKLAPHLVINKMIALAKEEGYLVNNISLVYYDSSYKVMVDTELLTTKIGGVS